MHHLSSILIFDKFCVFNLQMVEVMNLRIVRLYKKPRETNEKKFKQVYSFNEEHIQWITTHFLGEYNETRASALSILLKMEIFFRCICDPAFQLAVVKELGAT